MKIPEYRAYRELAKQFLEREREIECGNGRRVEHWNRPNGKYYPFIPHDPDHAIQQLITVKKLLTTENRTERISFLDVGCGIGNIMVLAQSMGFKPAGIEYNKTLEKKSLVGYVGYGPEDLYGIVYCDAFKYKMYHKFDVVYMYCPISDYALEKRLERKIENALSVGTYFICNYKQDQRIHKDPRFTPVNNEMFDTNIWKKVAA